MDAARKRQSGEVRQRQRAQLRDQPRRRKFPCRQGKNPSRQRKSALLTSKNHVISNPWLQFYRLVGSGIPHGPQRNGSGIWRPGFGVALLAYQVTP